MTEGQEHQVQGGARSERQFVRLDSPKSVFAFALLSVPISVTAAASLAMAIEYTFDLDSVAANSIGEFLRRGMGAIKLLSALLFAPLIENSLCLLWVVWLEGWKAKSWWAKPACIAAIAACFHILALGDLRSFSVFPGFFVMTTLIVNTKDRSVGFWASVLHHFCINAVVTLLACWLGATVGLKG